MKAIEYANLIVSNKETNEYEASLSKQTMYNIRSHIKFFSEVYSGSLPYEFSSLAELRSLKKALKNAHPVFYLKLIEKKPSYNSLTKQLNTLRKTIGDEHFKHGTIPDFTLPENAEIHHYIALIERCILVFLSTEIGNLKDLREFTGNKIVDVGIKEDFINLIASVATQAMINAKGLHANLLPYKKEYEQPYDSYKLIMFTLISRCLIKIMKENYEPKC